MSDTHSTVVLTPAKPERPEGSPLFWHATGAAGANGFAASCTISVAALTKRRSKSTTT